MSVQLKRLEMDLHKIRAARTESELRILERQEEIRRIEESHALQSARELELEKELNDLKSKE